MKEQLATRTREYYDEQVRLAELAIQWKDNPKDEGLRGQLLESLEKLGLVVDSADREPL